MIGKEEKRVEAWLGYRSQTFPPNVDGDETKMITHRVAGKASVNEKNNEVAAGS